MDISMPEEVRKGFRFIYEGKEEEAWHIIANWEKTEYIKPQEQKSTNLRKNGSSFIEFHS
ncbi:MAG: hypothetical protein ACFFG0_20320 [Candidatus Thorarchaeota archaeon]